MAWKIESLECPFIADTAIYIYYSPETKKITFTFSSFNDDISQSDFIKMSEWMKEVSENYKPDFNYLEKAYSD